jgi:hypothetical protein
MRVKKAEPGWAALIVRDPGAPALSNQRSYE